MASRLSRGCLRCRTRKVKCDEGRPSCQRCITRNELCTGYRDEASLIFRYENQKVARKNVRRRASTPSLTECGTSSQWSETSGNSRSSKEIPLVKDPTNLSTVEISSLNLSAPFPWAKSAPDASLPSAEDQAVFRFFEKFVMYPGNQGSSPGFLEHLPCLFNEVKVEGRLALRWAVRAVAYASLSSEQSNLALGNKALQCYGLALSALADSLADPREAPDDYTLMTVVILDLFEGVYLQDSVAIGSHAEGMAQILRLRGPKQIYSARGWSLFRLSHHRLQKQQLAFHKSPLPDSEEWLNSLNEELPYVRAEKDNFQISKICEKARNLRRDINNSGLSVTETLKLVKEMHTLDKVTTTWREGPEWAFKTIRRSEIVGVDETSDFPEFIQLHRDIWLAYEWNYHRTARTILHEHLLLCLDRLQSLCSVFPGNQEALNAELCSLKQASITIIQTLTDEVLSTVPQSLGDIDNDGNIVHKTSKATKCQGIGGYFLLWSIKVAKSTRSATAQQKAAAQKTFEQIRDCTGMRSALGEASNI